MTALETIEPAPLRRSSSSTAASPPARIFGGCLSPRCRQARRIEARARSRRKIAGGALAASRKQALMRDGVSARRGPSRARGVGTCLGDGAEEGGWNLSGRGRLRSAGCGRGGGGCSTCRNGSEERSEGEREK